MELKLKFNEDAANYDRWRPIYVPELFRTIADYSGLDSTKKSLEIGIGTGQATLPILRTGCDITAIEIGENLAKYTKQKFRKFSNFHVVNIDFESFKAESSTYDLIYSATAFHWIPEEIGYSKAFDLLKHGGTLALFWNHPFVNREDDALHKEIQKFYNKYPPSNSQPPIEFNENNCQRILTILQKHNFTNISSQLFYQTRRFSAQDYISLLNTYSDHRAMPVEVRKSLEQGILSVIEEYGGTLNVYDTMDLYLAQKS
jgi:SAM-dependent methyltransferase